MTLIKKYFLTILMSILLVLQIFQLFQKTPEPTVASAQQCVAVNTKPCYCIWCREGTSHFGNDPSCSQNGAWTSSNDVHNTGQGCRMWMTLVAPTDACPFPPGWHP